MKQLLRVGDRLVSVWLAGSNSNYDAGKQGIISIGIDELPGPMGMYLVANILRDNGPDVIIPLHMAEGFMVSNP